MQGNLTLVPYCHHEKLVTVRVRVPLRRAVRRALAVHPRRSPVRGIEAVSRTRRSPVESG